MNPKPATANRLALGLMAHLGIGYDEAVGRLRSLTLQLVCDERIACSAALQAALITALNCGQRAFLGGINLRLPESVPLLIPWPTARTLNEVVDELLRSHLPGAGDATQTIYFGFRPEKPERHGLVVLCSGWRGGVEPAAVESKFEYGDDPDFALGGVFAGALALHRGFVRTAAISVFACEEAAGLSLWQPGADWLAASSAGPALTALPEALWLLGLGHLGQAFAWVLGFLPFADPGKCEVILQDFDRIEDANICTGLLTRDEHIGQYKTRVCASWLEARGYRTKISERKFDEKTCRQEGEPAIAICGFDRPEPRRLLEGADFAHVIECGLGGSIVDFDWIQLHVFPGRRRADEIWRHAVVAQGDQSQARLAQAIAEPGETCGALAIETAGKAVSTSFIGAMAATVAYSEILRAFHGGTRHDEIYLSARNFIDADFRAMPAPYMVAAIGELGYCDASAGIERVSHPPKVAGCARRAMDFYDGQGN